MNLQAIREQRAGLVADMRSMLAKAETEKRSLSGDEQASFDTMKSKIADLEGQEGRAQFLLDAERRMTGTPATGSGLADFDRECRAFSITKAIAAQLPNSTVDAGREREVSQELSRRAGRPFEGIAVPLAVFEERVLTTAAPVGGPGSNIVATDHRGDQFIDRLRASLRISQLGATVLSGLVGNVDIPKLKASATAGWVAENAGITPSDHEFTKISLTPKHCGALTEFSRNMLLQSSPDIESLVRRDFAAILAEAIDAAAIVGGGSNEPDGLVTLAGTSAVSTGTLAGPTWAQVLTIIETAETDNATANAWLTHPSVVRKLRSTLKESGDAGAGYLMDAPGALAGYSLASSTLVPSGGSPAAGTIIFGNWSDLLIGYWSAFDLLVNPYESTAYSKGNVQVRAMLTTDVAVRHGESFVVVDDVPV